MAFKGHMLTQNVKKIFNSRDGLISFKIQYKQSDLRTKNLLFASRTIHTLHSDRDLRRNHHTKSAQISSPLLENLLLHNKFKILGHNILCLKQYSSNDGEFKIIGKHVQNALETPEDKKENDSDKPDPVLTDKKKWGPILGISIAAWGYILFFVYLCGMSVGGYIILGREEVDEDHNVIRDEFSDLPWVKAYALRFQKKVNEYYKNVREPSAKKLLPDPLKEPYYQPKYTLVIEMIDLLVHPDHKWATGWRYKKRPGVEFFLQQIGYPKFEVVIYTKEQGMTAWSVLEQLDQQGHIPFRLFRDATRYEGGVHKKDIRHLNRDESKIIIVDTDPDAISLCPRNSIVLDPWDGETVDQTLVDLAALLNMLNQSGVDDVRTVLDNYHSQGPDVLSTFRERKQAFLEQQQQKAATPKSPQSSILSKYTKR